jgi:hypothetical protein
VQQNKDGAFGFVCYGKENDKYYGPEQAKNAE